VRAPDQIDPAFTKNDEAVHTIEVGPQQIDVEALAVDEVGLRGPTLSARLASVGARHKFQQNRNVVDTRAAKRQGIHCPNDIGLAVATSGGAGAAQLLGVAGPRSPAEQAGEETARGFHLHVALAALVSRHALHDLVDVLAAPGPGGLLTGCAGDGSAHGGGLSLGK
jgi:hypothetical protein